MNIAINFYAYEKDFFNYLNSLKNLNFSAFNPVFWLFLLALLLILLKFWNIRKSFSFCVVIAIILLADTKVESLVIDFFNRNAEAFDPVIVRIISAFLILLVILYYTFVRVDE